MLLRLIYSLLFLCACCPIVAQEYNYVHYSEKDGLAGSTVYDMCQDKDGFMWFATESGLSRYDGTRFTTFTTKDGLPDNEVLKVFADSKGRVWIGTFNKELSYYYKGKVYNKRNDTLLNKLVLASVRLAFAEDSSGIVFISDEKNVIIISETKGVVKLLGESITGRKENIFNIINYMGDIIATDVLSRDGYKYDSSKCQFPFYRNFPQEFVRIGNAGPQRFLVCYDEKGNPISLPQKNGRLNYEAYKNKSTWSNTSEGAWQIDTVNMKWGDLFLPGKAVTRTITDYEKNTWFATLGSGAYKLSSMSFKTLVSSKSTTANNIGIYAFEKYEHGIIAGTDYNKAHLIKDGIVTGNLDFTANYKFSNNPVQNNRLYTIKTLSNGTTLLGFDAFLVKLGKGPASFSYRYPIKSIDEIDSSHIIIGIEEHVFKMKVSDFSITDTLWRSRCTKVLYANQKYYMGTVNGLYEVNQDKSFTYLGTLHHALSRRIADIKKDGSGILWIATSDAGIVAYKDGKIVHTVTENDGLASDICKTLFWQPPFLWAGTNKGLSKINTEQLNVPILNYSTSDGLASDFINAVYVEDSMVYVGTPSGITVFNENAVMSTSSCNLNMLGIKIGGRDTTVLDNYALSWHANSIGFEFVAISFKSAGDIVYKYMLEGLDTSWQQTRSTSINYPSLPTGEYTFLLEAVNKFGVKSKTIRVKFTIDAPLWKKWWFYVTVSVLVMGIALWIMQKRNQRIRKRLEEKNKMQRQLAELEQQALQSQMNPHFIFNCLNSIQQFIVLADIEEANKYLTAFARLIRQTLDNSAKKTLSIEEELTYLSSYLELEKMRFGNRFTYTIKVDDNIDKHDDWMPAMLLQPFAENSIRHGLADKKEEKGLLQISFAKEGNNIVCTIVDNGIGRQASFKRKSAAHIEYQSKGMSLTQKRIELINQNNQSHIQLTITDLYHPNPNNPQEEAKAAGTKVTLIIPQ